MNTDVTPLYPLQSVVKHGAARESLKSLIARIAAKHQLSCAHIINRLIIPIVSGRDVTISNQKSWANVGAIDGIGLTAKKWIFALEALTGMNGEYAPQTLLQWSTFIEQRDTCMASQRQWCPHCYNDDLIAGNPPYDRLLWAISNVTICHIHRLNLCNVCTYCGYEHKAWKSRSYLPGFCSNCQSWLGTVKSSAIETTFKDGQFLFRTWASLNTAALLDRPSMESKLDAKNISGMLREVCNLYFSGNQAALARHLNRSKSLVHMWCNATVIPRWAVLIEISYALQLPLLDMLTADVNAVPFCSLLAIPSSEIGKRKLRTPNRNHDWEHYQNYLREVIDGKWPKIDSAEQAAKHLKISRRTLKMKFPALLSEVVASCKSRKNLKIINRKLIRDQVLQQAMESTVELLIKTGKKPSRRTVFPLLEASGFSICPWRDQKLLTKVKQARG